MLKFVSFRLLSSLVTLFLVITATFFLMFLVPGGPFLSEKINAATLAQINKKYGLDQPVYVQYGNYLKNLVKGDLGISFKRRGYTITEIIAEKFPVSAKLGALAIICALLVGLPAGMLAATKRNTVVDRIIMAVCTLGIALPSFIVSTTLLYILGMQFKVLPVIGLETPRNYIMPVFALSLSPTCYITRLLRSSILDIQGQDYLKTARAKGLGEQVVLFKHALKNALIPVITYMGPMVAGILTGSLVIEKIFSIPGLGKYFIDSIEGRDYTLIMGTTIFFAAILIVANLIVDILYCLVDPRIKY
ncbi:MAG: ABC transporter permease [Clostridiales bacterium]|jgi:oligopeptide transport system permease protein|nr:ABC transporter permease [Clostridiales bacterium]